MSDCIYKVHQNMDFVIIFKWHSLIGNSFKPYNMFQDRLYWFGKRLTCSWYVAYVKFSHNVTYCRSIIVNWKKTHHDIPTLYSLLKLVNKSINIWPFSYWPCYMPLVLIMASDSCNGTRCCLGSLQPSSAIINTSGM